jgi:hypothetical protein
MPCVNMGSPPGLSARKRPPPSVPLAGDGQCIAADQFRSTTPRTIKDALALTATGHCPFLSDPEE